MASFFDMTFCSKWQRDNKQTNQNYNVDGLNMKKKVEW